MKKVVIVFWVLAAGTFLWFLSKVKSESLLGDWSIFVFTIFAAALAGDILIKLLNIRWYCRQWSELAGLGVLFFLGVAVILMGIFLSALKAMGASWPGVIIASSGISYFYWVVLRIEKKFKQLSA